MKRFLSQKLYKHLSTRRDSFLTRSLMRVANFTQRAYFNSSNHDIRVNGEGLAIEKCYRTLKDPETPFIIFDVGGNEGHWSEVALELCPKCKIHIFEIVPDTRDILKSNLAQFDNVTINEAGLSNMEQEVEIKFYPKSNTGSSEYDLPWGAEHVLIKAKCDQGDKYMERKGIERINLLKIDVEGADYKVLEGFENAFREQRIDFVQFEYNKAAVHSKRMLKDFYDLLGSHQYEIGRILPNKVDFKEYDLFRDENLLQSNFFAARSDLRKPYENA